MNDDFTRIWFALSELDEHFASLGGSARYHGYFESDVPLYVLCFLAKKYSADFNLQVYVSACFLTGASHVRETVDAHLDKITVVGLSLIQLMNDIKEYSNSKLTERQRSREWNRLGEWIQQEYIRITNITTEA